MEINIDDIDIGKLRKDLIDHFMAIMFNVSMAASLDVNKVENASNEELIEIAIRNKFDISKYKKNKRKYL